MTTSLISRLLPIRRIVSGGQTGVDRAALDVAMELGLEHGGWCPQGRRAEDGPIDRGYNLRETRSAKYHVRTRRNVLDSDGTLIFYREEMTGGTELTLRYAIEHLRPYLAVDLFDGDWQAIRRWLIESGIETLNVAGPRESTAPGIYDEARTALHAVLLSRKRNRRTGNRTKGSQPNTRRSPAG